MGGIVRAAEGIQRIGERSDFRDFAAKNPAWMNNPELAQQAIAISPELGMQGLDRGEKLRQMQWRRASDRLEAQMSMDAEAYTAYEAALSHGRTPDEGELTMYGGASGIPDFAKAEEAANDVYQRGRLQYGQVFGDDAVQTLAPAWNLDSYTEREPLQQMVANSLRQPVVVEGPDGTAESRAFTPAELSRHLRENPGSQVWNQGAYQRRTAEQAKGKWESMGLLERWNFIEGMKERGAPPDKVAQLEALAVGLPATAKGEWESLPGVKERFEYLKDPERGQKLDPKLRAKLLKDTVGEEAAANAWRLQNLPAGGADGRWWADEAQTRLEPIPGGPRDLQVIASAAAAADNARPLNAWRYDELPPAAVAKGIRWKDRDRSAFEVTPGSDLDLASAPQALTPEQRTKVQADFRKEFLPLTRNFQQQRDGMLRIASASQEPSAAGDIQLLIGFMKVNDPDSVVRESEFATAQSAGSLPERIRAAGIQIANGQRLTDEQRADFVNQAIGAYDQSAALQQGLVNQYTGFAEKAGADPKQSVVDLFPGEDAQKMLAQVKENARGILARAKREGTPAPARPVAELAPAQQQQAAARVQQVQGAAQAGDFSSLTDDELATITVPPAQQAALDAELRKRFPELATEGK